MSLLTIHHILPIIITALNTLVSHWEVDSILYCDKDSDKITSEMSTDKGNGAAS